MQFCPCGFVLSCFVALPLVCPIPATSWFVVGPCVLVSILTYTEKAASQVAGWGWGEDPWGVAMVTPLFALGPHLLVACFAVN